MLFVLTIGDALAQMALQGDPRRPNEAQKYNRPVVTAESQPPDTFLFLALLAGMVALILKVCWVNP